LHDADDGASSIGEILDGGDDIGGVEEGLRLRGEQHVEAEERERRRGDPRDGEPDGEVADGAEGGAGEEDEPGAAAAGGGPCGEEAGEDAGVGADVLEEGDLVEGGLVVGLGGLERRGVDGEAVGAPREALDERARRQRRPPGARGHRRRP
ncbi:Os12g0639150, partial [Oryza sativa Japonica Group]